MQVEQPIASYNGTPQLEDGFTRIANELLLAVIQFKFSERQYKILFALIRKTYGFNKINDEISLSQLSVICKLPINHVSTVINQLVKLNVIIKKQGKHAHSLGINKLYDTWGGLHNVECHIVEFQLTDNGVTSLGVKGLHNVEVQKTTPKDNPKESNSKRKSLVTLKTFLEPYSLHGRDVFNDDDTIFEFAENAGIPIEFLHLGWLSFKNQFIDDEDAKQKDWKSHFRNYLRKGWLKIWYFKDGICYLNAAGVALQNYEKNKAKNGQH